MAYFLVQRIAAVKKIALLAILFLAILVIRERTALRNWIEGADVKPIPSPVPYLSVSVVPSRTPSPSRIQTPTTSPTPAPGAVNLAIPFVSQAPHKIWDTDHEDFCEEAASLMAASYINGDLSVTDIDVAEAALQAAKAWEMKTFGYFESTTAAQTAQMLREHFGMSAVSLVSNPSAKQIRDWVAAGKAVVVPSAGRKLGNPNFTGLGPLYHMLVVKGFTADGHFITNDPGTRLGADYLYTTDVLMNAIHDWNNGDVDNGARVVIVVG